MLPHPPYVTRTNTKTVPWTMTVLAPREKMNCAIAVTLELTQQRQTKEQKTFESKRLPFCLTFFQSSFSPLCADWSEACFPPADTECVLNSAACFRPAAEKSEDVLRAVNVITQSSCELQSMVWLKATLVHYCLQHSLYFASCLSATSSVTCVADCLLLTLLCFSACLLTARLTHCLKHLSATCSVMRVAETPYLSGCLLMTLLMHRLKHPSATCPAMCVADCLLTTLFVLVWRPADNGH